MLYALIPPEGMNSMYAFTTFIITRGKKKNIYISDTCLIKPVCNVQMYIVSIYIICFTNSRKYHPATYTNIRAKNSKGAE